MAEECTVYVKPHEVAGELDALDLTVEILRAAVDEGIRPRLSCTDNDPDFLLGVLGSGKITRALRDRLVKQPHNWTRDKYRNQPSTVHPGGKVRIIVASGTEDTGIKDGEPATRSAKGEATKDAVRKNQLTLFDIDPTFASGNLTTSLDQTWVLLHYVDWEAGEVRAEFSLPKSMDEDDYVTGWRVRVILEAIPIQRDPIAVVEDDQDDDALYKVDVQPRVG